MNRRQLLQTGTASILIMGALTGCDNDPSFSQAWRTLGDDYTDPRLRILASAILAPSPHNRQPWQVALSADDPAAMTLYADLSRRLPETDPPNRQILIGLGAFLEALDLAAAEAGLTAQMDILPEGVGEAQLDDRPIAHITLLAIEASEPDPLYAYLRERRTNRAKFTAQSVPEADLAALGAGLKTGASAWSASSDPDQCAALRRLCTAGWEIEMITPRTHLESVNLTRIGRNEIKDNPDGISLSGGIISAYSALGILTREKMADPQSRAFSEGFKFYADLIDSAQSFGWLVTADNSRASQVAAGRDWLRVHLAATRAGIALQPLSQALQEFPEMSELYAETHTTLSVQSPARIQGLFRLGYAPSPPPSPRWPLRTRLINAA